MTTRPRTRRFGCNTGSAFDMTGERQPDGIPVRLQCTVGLMNRLRSRCGITRPSPSSRIVDSLRWTSWDIVKNSNAIQEKRAQTIEFLVQIHATGEKNRKLSKVH